MNSYSPYSTAPPRGGVTIPRIWITAACSILLHLLLFWQIRPDLRSISSEEAEKGEARSSLSVRIAPPPRPPGPLAQRPAVPVPPAPPARPRAAPLPKPAPKPAPKPPPPPVIARATPAPEAPRAPPPQPVPQQPREAPSPAPAPRDGDFASLVEARRRARGESPAPAPASDAAPAAAAAPAEDPRERANRIAALNLGTNRTPTYGERRVGGGVFTIRHVAYDYAEFLFYGWNKDIKRDTAQVIEVRKGSNANIRIAIVRRMIAIIREHEQGDFVWESPRTNRRVTLSARQRDNAGLEAFLMREFFEE